MIAEMLCKLPEGTTLRSYLFILLLNKGVNQSINQSCRESTKGSFLYIKIQLDNKAKKTQIKEIE